MYTLLYWDSVRVVSDGCQLARRDLDEPRGPTTSLLKVISSYKVLWNQRLPIRII